MKHVSVTLYLMRRNRKSFAVKSEGVENNSGPRDAAMWALARLERDSAYLDRLIPEMHRRAGTDVRDQNLAEAIVKCTLENQQALENMIDPFVDGFDRSAPELRAALFVGATQLKVLTGVPNHAAVSETVNAARRFLGSARAGLVNAVLRRVSEAGPLEKMTGLPSWVVSRFTEQYGEESVALLESLETQLPIFVRCNPLKITPADCVAALAEVGVSAVPFSGLPQVLTLSLNGVRIPNQVFSRGVCTVQDPSAVLVGLALNPQPGERVLDVCSAPGGKTTHIAELMQNQGLVQASDINENRLALVAQHAERLGLSAVTTKQGDATRGFQDNQSQNDVFDRVLVDAPCSGTGVLAKKRDALAKKREEDLKKLIDLQRSLLKSAAKAVKSPGGTLVYSTCSLDRSENEDQVSWFIAQHPEFSLVRDHPLVPVQFVTEQGFVKALPHKHGCAGGFAAVLRRN